MPVDELHWIDIPGQGAVTGSTARIYYSPAWGPGRYRTGRVLRLVPGLESTGRLAELLVAVDDPLQLAVPVDERLPLILNSYVRVKIGGRELKSVVRVPRTAIRDGNKVWIVNGDKTLAIRDVKIEWSGADSVLVSAGLSAGEMLITSDLATPVPGMSVRLADTSEVKGE